MQNHTVQLFRVGDGEKQEPEFIKEISVESGTTVMQAIDEQRIQLRRFCNQGFCAQCECAALKGTENLKHNKNGRAPANPNQVRVCVTEVHGDVSILIKQKPSILASTKAAIPQSSAE